MTKLVLCLAVLGLIALDGFAVVSATFSAADRANTYASDAADNFHATHDVNKAYALAVAEAKDHSDTIDPKSFVIDSAGVVQLTVHHTTKTLWMSKIGPLKQYTEISESGRGDGPS